MRPNQLVEKATIGASIRCIEALGTTLVASSRTLGWQSLLIDHDRICEPACEIETAITPDLTIVAMLSGNQTIGIRKRGGWCEANYAPGTVGMTPGGHSNMLRRRIAEIGPPPEKAVIYLPSNRLAEAADHYRRAGHRDNAVDLNALAFDDPAIVAVAVSLLRAVRSAAPDLYADSAAQWLAVHLLSKHAGWRSLNDDTRSPGAITDRRLQRVLSFMSEQFREPLTLPQLASVAGVSKFHFVRLFRAKTGVTPMAYLLTLRLEHARSLLISGGLDVAAVARQCGYATTTHFTTAFRRRFDVTPSEIRRRAGQPRS